jgi:SWI/SNF-related matrix-associated actin-dependent regulator of chromatin subfamily A member 5
MVKEDRSDWVAVAPEFAPTAEKIKAAQTAYSFFQRDVTPEVRDEMIAQGGFEIGKLSRACRDKWNVLDPGRKEDYDELARDDQARFARESHAADVAAIERREKLLRERDQVMLDNEGGGIRSTRGGLKKKKRKKERKEKRKQKVGGDDESSDSSDEDDDSSSESDDSGSPKKLKKKKTKAAPRQPTQKQIEHRGKMKRDKQEKEDNINEKHDDLRKEKSAQAKRRLEFLLKQSNIFSHFGQAKEDQAKYGIKSTEPASARPEGASLSRRDSTEDDKREQELDEADEHQATFLTAQPTTIAHGKMRQYQLEGLNWMIGLQENGVNGILADEVCMRYFAEFLKRWWTYPNGVSLIRRWASERRSNLFLFWCTCWSIKIALDRT